ncbi:hypothetical protein IF803_07125 [Bradyrhizobium sp. UFLA06-06]
MSGTKARSSVANHGVARPEEVNALRDVSISGTFDLSTREDQMEIGKTSVLSPKYDEFLFAVICEDGNGMQISVLSALTRIDVDPWEEAACLDGMAGTRARKRFVAVLDKVSGQNWSGPQKEEVASRLLGLLPSFKGTANSTPASEISLRLLFCLVIWWGFLLATAVSTYHHHRADGVSTSYSIRTDPVRNSSNARIAKD